MSKGNNKNLTEAINELEEVFRDRFHFSENQVKEFIERILKNGDEEVTQKLSEAMKKFVEFAGSPKDESRAFATRAVKKALDLYLDRQEEIKDDFFLMVDDIKNHNVDPYKIAYKENYREADYDAYEKTLSALTEKVYSDGVTNFKLFDETALKDLLETCSTIIFRVTEENTQDIIDYLSVLMYDEKSKSFIMSPKELISKVPSILLRSADSIATNIEALKKLYVNDKFSEVDLARKIAQTPSILTCSTDNISYFNTKYKSVMRNLIFKRGVSSNGNNKFGVDLHELYNKTVESVLNNIDNLSWISQLTEDNINSIENISKVLYKRLGVKNALACMRNVNFLTKEPDLLDCLICTLVEKQKQTGENYIKYLIEHPNMAFNGRFGLTSSGSAPTVAPVSTHKKNRVTADKIDEITAEEIKRVKLANKKHSAKVEMIIQNIIDGMSKPQEEPVVEQQTKVPTITPPQENVSAPTIQPEEQKQDEPEKPEQEVTVEKAEKKVGSEEETSRLIVEKMKSLDNMQFGDVNEEILTRVAAAYRIAFPDDLDGEKHLGINLSETLSNYKQAVSQFDFDFDAFIAEEKFCEISAGYMFGKDILHATDLSNAKKSHAKITKAESCMIVNLMKLYNTIRHFEHGSGIFEGAIARIVKETGCSYAIPDKKLQSAGDAAAHYVYYALTGLVHDIIYQTYKQLGINASSVIPMDLIKRYDKAPVTNKLFEIVHIKLDSFMYDALYKNIDNALDISERFGRTPAQRAELFLKKYDLLGADGASLKKTIKYLARLDNKKIEIKQDKNGLYIVYGEIHDDPENKYVVCYPKSEIDDKLQALHFPEMNFSQYRDHRFSIATNYGMAQNLILNNTNAQRFMENQDDYKSFESNYKT